MVSPSASSGYFRIQFYYLDEYENKKQHLGCVLYKTSLLWSLVGDEIVDQALYYLRGNGPRYLPPFWTQAATAFSSGVSSSPDPMRPQPLRLGVQS